MPVVVEEVSVETISEPQAPQAQASAAPAESDSKPANRTSHELLQQLASLRERDERVRAH